MTDGIKEAGVDEAGRGPLAGPVVAAAVILDPNRPIRGLKDSKLIKEIDRERLYERIIDRCLAFGVGEADWLEIDQHNILQASLLAMKRAIQNLTITPDKISVDGPYCPDVPGLVTAIIDGDNKVRVISAASIVAKVTRDRQMRAYDKIFPGYGFAQHKGYGTRGHLEALRRLGISPIHRLSFAPVREVLEALT